MLLIPVKQGSTDVTIQVFIQDNTGTDAGAAGLEHDTSGLHAYYARTRESSSQISLVTQTPDGAHTDGGFCEIDPDGPMYGAYRLDLPDAIAASLTQSNPTALVYIHGTGLAPTVVELYLSNIDFQTSIPDQVLDAATEDHEVAGSFGYELGNTTPSLIAEVILWLGADSYVDTTTTPWSLVVHKRSDPTTVYFKKSLKDTANANVISTTSVIGRHVHLA